MNERIQRKDINESISNFFIVNKHIRLIIRVLILCLDWEKETARSHWGQKKKTQPDDVNPSLLIKFVTLPTFLGGDAKKMFYWRSRTSEDQKQLTESLLAKKPWHIQRRVVPSRQMYEKPFSWLRSGAQNETFSIVWSTIKPYRWKSFIRQWKSDWLDTTPFVAGSFLWWTRK